MEIICDKQLNELIHDRVYVYTSLYLYKGLFETIHTNNKNQSIL